MTPAQSLGPPTRWKTRSVVITAVAISLAAAIWTLSLVGFGRTMTALIRFAPAAGEQMAPETASAPATTFTTATETRNTAEADVAPPAAAEAATGGAPGVVAPRSEPVAVSGADGGGGTAGFGGAGGTAGAGGDGGGGGALPSASVACGAATCRADQKCCNASCGICTAPDESCTQQLCGVPNVSASVVCGPNTCNVGQVCCNASCGTCGAPGASCDQAQCSNSPKPPSSDRCGSALCNNGQVCCNASCGICSAPGQACSHDVCS